MEQWNNFLQFEYASEVLIIVGALMTLIGVMKILGSSLRLLFWVLLCGLGASAVTYGLERSGTEIPLNLAEELKAFVGPGRELSVDAMRVLCERLDNQPASE